MSININEYLSYLKDTVFMEAEMKELESNKETPLHLNNHDLFEALRTYLTGKCDYLCALAIPGASQYICITQEATQKLSERLQQRIDDEEMQITSYRKALLYINKYNEATQAHSAVALDSDYVCGIFRVEHYGEQFYYFNNGSSVNELLQKYANCNGQLNELNVGCPETDESIYAWYEQKGILSIDFNVDRNELKIRQGNETEESIRTASYDLTNAVEDIKQRSFVPEKTYTLSFTENELKMLNAGLVQLCTANVDTSQMSAIANIINKFTLIGNEINHHNTLEDNGLVADDELCL